MPREGVLRQGTVLLEAVFEWSFCQYSSFDRQEGHSDVVSPSVRGKHRVPCQHTENPHPLFLPHYTLISYRRESRRVRV